MPSSDPRPNPTYASPKPSQTFVQTLGRESSRWRESADFEQAAFALSAITAAHLLPPLTNLPCGTDLLMYHANLRGLADPLVIDELRLVLRTSWRELGWEQIGDNTFLCVIGAGVAGCIDTSSGCESLYLRYASELEHALFLAGRAVDLPRSRLFLQTTLYEKVDVLLNEVRVRLWHWFIN